MPSSLYRSRSQKMIAGVAGGLGEYFDVDPVLIRLLFVVTSFISGAGILAYIVLWIVLPVEGDDTTRMDAFRRDIDDLSSRVRDRIDPHAGPSRPAGAPTSSDVAAGPVADPPTTSDPVTASGEASTVSGTVPDADLNLGDPPAPPTAGYDPAP